MKLTLSAFFIFLSLNSFAQDLNPMDFCQQTGECTSKMLEITDQFGAGNGLFTEAPLSAFSGSCYHLSSIYNPYTEHHGAFYFENVKNEFFVDGFFGFYHGEDPYQSLNSAQLKEVFLSRSSVPFKAIKKSNQAELSIKSETSNYHYWFRTNIDQSKMYLIGLQFSGNYPSFVFCDFTSRR